MKRIISITLCLIFALSALSLSAFAQLIDYTVYVTIADENGDIVVNEAPFSAGGVQEGTGMPIFAALKSIHDLYYEGGAEAGFAFEKTDYGMSLTKLWGVENGGAYGYYVNHRPANSLSDILQNGDRLYAWVYRDTVKYTDTYCYFEPDTDLREISAQEPFSATLYKVSFDENWQPVSVPFSGASVTDNGEPTGIVTDEEGRFTVTPEAGTHLYKAVSDDVLTVGPALNITALPAAPTVYVTISDGSGELPVIQEPVAVVDADHDTTLTISDALYLAHERFYDGGAAAGYEATVHPDYGLSLSMLWGVRNGGSYGYYVNHNAAWSLGDEVHEGDCLDAFVYSDTKHFSDKYCFFDRPVSEEEANKDFSVSLYKADYDENWNPITVAAEGAVLTIDGEKTDYTVSEDGSVLVRIPTPGVHILSAVSEKETLVPPAMTVIVSDNALIGDADMDGTVSVLDATYIQKYKANLITEEKINLSVSDTDADGVVSVLDATRIQKYKAKICNLDGTPYTPAS